MEKVPTKMRGQRRISPFAFLLLLFGGFLIGYPLYGSLTTRAAVQRLDTEWEQARRELPGAEIGDMTAASPVSHLTAASQMDSGHAQAKPTSSSRVHSIGRIVIPRIDLTAPIGTGAATETLRYSVGHLEGSAALGGIGNTVLAGHRSYTYGEFFNRLDEVKIGDTVTIETIKEDIIYKVTESKVVEPTDLSVLADSAPKSLITLITCTPKNSSRYRLIVTAEQVSRKAIHKD